ncbi:uncharacterized protein RCC_08883 [Ramularia collo-cygni]|uniref:Uncharacterized protein n=1 Tax=Ramularia collo-cygni TaxID=112498 RepID=A0A2D3V5A7_9PEZI|nr:uncharacterized protein RCC_08883 [Ramularia collo-cygni]CZT23173.1 uncharacterized protein RCC_08883 [Ramularia collo-cygni]
MFGTFLALQTRLNDREFSKTAPSFARISHERQAFFLGEGLRLAQWSLWETSREYMPEVQNRLWCEGPWMVRLENKDLTDQFGEGLPEMKSRDVDSSARDAMRDVSLLRNSVCHPGTDFPDQQTKNIDDLLYHAHHMAVLLHDSKHAGALRALRDRVQTEVMRSYKEIQLAHAALRENYQDVVAKKWDLHQERTFWHALRFPANTLDVIIEVAIAWNKGGHPLSKVDPVSGFAVDEETYLRVPGQDEDYFARLHRDDWDAHTPTFQRVVRKLGASRADSTMSAYAMRMLIDAETPAAEPWEDEPEVVAGRVRQQERNLQRNVDAGAFNYARIQSDRSTRSTSSGSTRYAIAPSEPDSDAEAPTP